MRSANKAGDTGEGRDVYCRAGKLIAVRLKD
jgi:hypothetical protein